jgi:ElaB/YqjD/DUF883 family membrane-anchored ribosome-binding protein
MIRIADKQFQSTASSGRPDPQTENSLQGWKQGLELWVRTRPRLTLALAATAGAALGWLIKRRQ